jgi:hypothetical protein
MMHGQQNVKNSAVGVFDTPAPNKIIHTPRPKLRFPIKMKGKVIKNYCVVAFM